MEVPSFAFYWQLTKKSVNSSEPHHLVTVGTRILHFCCYLNQIETKTICFKAHLVISANGPTSFSSYFCELRNWVAKRPFWRITVLAKLLHVLSSQPYSDCSQVCQRGMSEKVFFVSNDIQKRSFRGRNCHFHLRVASSIVSDRYAFFLRLS